MSFEINEILKEYVKSNRTFFKIAKKLQPKKPLSKLWPTNLNFEITTICNSKCSFCTHEELIRSGKRKAKNMDVSLIQTVVEKFSEMTTNIPPEELKMVNVTGLGEPLLHPKYFETLRLIRKYFPQTVIGTNTNGICLDQKKARKIIDFPP